MTLNDNMVEVFLECYLLGKEFIDKKEIQVFAESYIERWQNAGFEIEHSIDQLAGEDKDLNIALTNYFENDIVDNDE
tara:strand:+ start:538 stop:768 length:231 start_codon:yes stop_codon:yes gene_type:complete